MLRIAILPPLIQSPNQLVNQSTSKPITSNADQTHTERIPNDRIGMLDLADLLQQSHGTTGIETMALNLRMLYTRTVTFGLLLAVLWTSLAGIRPASAQEPPPLAETEIRIVGLEIQPSPAALVAPKNIGTIVTPLLIRSDGVTGELPALPEDSFYLAQLRGPAFKEPIPVSAPLNGSFPIPPLALAGNYTLENIRLVHKGNVLIQADPDTVTIEVIERVLETQVTVKPLTAEEIQQRGIYIDQSNYQILNFTVAFGLENQEIKIDFPMILPASQMGSTPGVPMPKIPNYSIGRMQMGVAMPALELALKTPNIELTGFGLSVPEDDEPRKFVLPPIPGVVIIPGNIGYLNQFFSVMVKVTNGAPGYANLVVKDLKAEILLPTGADGVAGTSDDPLRMARLGTPPAEQSRILSLVQAGPDKMLGTADDILELAPQQSGDAEFLVEGLREGVHRLNFKIKGTLHGLPSGPVPVEGVAVGMVEVRNPQFSITLHHPETVTAGELYDFMVTVTNISETPANFVSLSLLPRSISGAILQSSQTVQVQTIEPGDSATVTFRLLSQKTGTVTSNSIASDGIPGKFEFFTAVGELGIPMSPNVLVLPPTAKELPANLYNVGIGLLGQAYAVATAPFPPRGLLPMSREIIYERATDLAAAGQRVEMGEMLGSVARDIALDYTGNNFSRIESQYAREGFARIEQMKRSYRGFDELLRKSRRGAEFMTIVGDILGEGVAAQGLLPFQQEFAENAASRPGHLSVVVGNDNGTAPVLLTLTDPDGKRTGINAVGAPLLREIPYGNFFTLRQDNAGTSQMALLGVPQAGLHLVEVLGTGAGIFDLGLVLPEGSRLRRVTFENVTIGAGGKAQLFFTPGTNTSFSLAVDVDGDGVVEQTLTASGELVADPGPRLISATQVFIPNPKQHSSKYGILMAALFSEEIDPASAQHSVEIDTVTQYSVGNNKVRSVFVQPRGRVVTMWLRDGIGAFVDRQLTVTDIKDLADNPLLDNSATAPIRTVKQTVDGLKRIVPGIAGQVQGVVRRADSTPVPFARLYMSQVEYDLNDEAYWVVVTVKEANADGSYSIDYVRSQGTRWLFLDPETNERGEVGAQPTFDGQILALDLILRGRGALAGRVTDQNGQPLADAYIKVTNLTNFGLGEDYGYAGRSNAEGHYAISGIPVGTVNIDAVHMGTRSQVKASTAISMAGSTVIQDLTLLSLDLPQNFGNIRGQVFRSDGVTPAVGIPVYTSLGGAAITDESGSYRIDGLPVGTLSVRAIDQTQLQEATVRTTLLANQTVTANLLLYGGTGTVKGSILDSDGNPLAGINIYGGFTLVTTGQDGAFTLTDMPMGNRTLTAVDMSTSLVQNANINITRPGEEVVVQIVFPVRGTLTGSVYRANGATPVPNLKLFALGPKNDVGYTDSQGAYRFEGMPKGDYIISAFLPDFSDGNLAKSKIVFKDETRVVNVIFRGKGAVTGTVYDDDGVTPLGARVALSEFMPKIGDLIPKENTECLADIDLGNGNKIDFPDCEKVVVDWKFVERSRYTNSNISSGAFTLNNTFIGDFVVEAANPFSPGVVTVKDTLPAPGATRAVTLSLQSTGVISGAVLLPDGTPATERVIVRAKVATVREPIAVVTDEQGRFYFPLVPAGGFTLTAEEDYGDRLVGQSGGSVKAGQSVEVSLRLLRRGSVTVTVVGANGPEANAPVTLREGIFSPRTIVKQSDSNGVAIFSGGDAVREGHFSVYAEKSGVKGHVGGLIQSVAEDPAGEVALTLTLRNDAAAVQGRFLRTDGVTGIPNAQIILNSAGNRFFTVTDTQGNYRFDGILAGAFTLEGFDPISGRRGRATGEVKAEHNNQTLTANMIQTALGTVTGSVRFSNTNAPVVGARVALNLQGSFGGNRWATTDANGTFRFAGVPATTFWVEANDYITGLRGLAYGSLSSEGENVTADVLIQIQPVGMVTGVVRNANGTPAIDARVDLLLLPQRGSQTTMVDANGVYSFPNVYLGRVSVRATAQVSGDIAEGVGDVSFEGDVEQIDLQFVGTGTVTGKVVTSDGLAAPATEVTLVRKTKTAPTYNKTTTTDSQGTFRFELVPLGELEVTANQRFKQLGGSVSLQLATLGATLDVTVTLEAAGSITGAVLRENGETPAVKMALELVSADGKVKRFGSTDESGNFRFDDLKLATYRLAVSDPVGQGIVDATATLVTAGEIVNLSALVLDDAPPAVLSITPANGTIHVPVNQTIQVQFSELVEATTVNGANLVVSTATGVVAGWWSLNEAATLATFTPAAPYRDFTQISLRVRTGIKDRVGRTLKNESVSSFTTTDSTPPIILARTPISGAQGAPVTTLVRVQWSEVVNPALFNGWPVTLTRNGIPVPVVRPVEFIQNNTVAVLTPLDPLQSDTVYQVTLQPATDLFGNQQAAPAVYTFRTQDLVAPVLRALQVAGSATVKAGNTAQITPDLESTADIAQVEYFVNGQSRFVAVVAPYTFALPVNVTQPTTATVTAQAVDFSGNVSERRSLVLELLPDAAPQVTILEPVAGSTVASGGQVSMTVRYEDDFALNKVLFQAKGAASASSQQTVPADTKVYTQSFTVNVPAATVPGSTLTLETSATDNANQASVIQSMVLTVTDGTRPTVQFMDPANNTTVDAGSSVSVTVRAADNGKVSKMRLMASGAAVFSETITVNPAISAATVTFALPISATASPTETITLTAEAEDGAGNVALPANRTLKIRDSQAPVVTITPAALQVIQGTSVTVTVAATDVIQVKTLGLRAEGALSTTLSHHVVGTPGSASQTFILNVPFTVTAGSIITLTGRATDAAGNEGSSQPVAITVTADAAPTAAILSPVEGSIIGTASSLAVQVALTDDVGVAQVRLQTSGAFESSQTLAVAPAAKTQTVTLTVEIAGDVVLGSSLTLAATAVDTQNQEAASAPVTVIVGQDQTLPTVQILSPAHNSLVNPGAVVEITAEGADNAAVAAFEFVISGAVSLTQTVTISPALETISTTLPITVPSTTTGNDSIVVSVRSEDSSGNRSAAKSITLKVRDLVAPQVSFTLSPNSSEVVAGTTVTATVVVSDEVGVSVLSLVASGEISSTQSATIFPPQARATRTFAVNVPADAAEGGAIVLVATARDAAGNVGTTAPVSLTVVVDAAPEVAIEAPAVVESGKPLTVTVTASDDEGVSSLTFQASGAVVTSTVRTITPPSTLYSETFVLDVPANAAWGSQITLSATATDSRGQSRQATPVIVTVDDATPPTVTITSPINNSAVNPGSTVNVSVQATDNGSVARIDFATAGIGSMSESRVISPALASTTQSFAVAVPVTATANSTFTVSALAVDSAGLESAPATITLRVADVIQPQVSITLPPGMTELVRGRSFTVTVSATDNVALNLLAARLTGGVSSYQNTSINSTPASAHTFTVNVPLSAVAGSTVTLTGEARDTANNTGVSAPLLFPVVDPSAQLSGFVFDDEENPVAGAELFITASNGRFTTTSGVDGFYSISGLADGAITVEARYLPAALYGYSTGTLTANNELLLDVYMTDYVMMQSVFTTGAEGWTVFGQGTLSWVGSGWNLLLIQDGSSANYFYFQAPAKFLGNFTAAYGKALEFDLQSINPVVQSSESDVILVGAGISLHYRTNRVPNNVMARYSVPLDLSTLGWTKDGPTGAAPTQAEFLAVLGDLQALRIRGDYGNGSSNGFLDNVLIRDAETRVHGLVSDVDGTPLAGLTLTVSGTHGVYQMVTNHEGRYEVRGIGAGSITAQAVKPDGLRRTVSGNLPHNENELVLNVNFLAAPVVAISSPADGISVIEGATLPVTVTASSGIGIARMVFLLDGQAVFTDTVAPYRADVAVPLGVNQVILGARAEDLNGNSTLAATVVVNVLSDDLTTVIGRVLDGTNGNIPVEGATITLDSFTAVSAADGTFTIAGVPTAQGSLKIIVRKTVDGKPLQAVRTMAVTGGVTDFGDVVINVVKFWDGGGNNSSWHTAANWNDDTLPTATDDVYIPASASVTFSFGATTVNSLYSDGLFTLSGDTLSVTAASTLNNFTVSGGTLSGSGEVTVNGLFTWTGGTMSGSGTLIASGGMVFSGNGTRILNARILENRGSATWGDDTDIYAWNGARIINAVGATWDIQGAGDIYWTTSHGAQSIFENAGTLTRSAGASTYINSLFINTGSVVVQAGSLQLRNGGSGSGAYHVAQGATLQFEGTHTLAATATVTGNGTITVNGGLFTTEGLYNVTGSTTVSGGSLVFAPTATIQNVGAQVTVSFGTLDFTSQSLSVATLWQSGGTITGSSIISVTDVFTWTGGVMSGAGRTVTMNKLAIGGSSIHTLDERTLENRSSAIWGDTGDIYAYYGSKIINAAGATWDIQTGADVYWHSGAGAQSTFENHGTLAKSAGAATYISSIFVNSGTVAVQTNILELRGVGSSSGLFDVSSGATFLFSSGHTLNNLVATGSGTLQFDSGTVTINGTYNAALTTRLSNGTAIVSSGAVVTMANLTVNAATFTNNVDLIVNGLFTWTGGTINGSGRLDTRGAVSLSGNVKILSAQTWDNRGNAIWTAGDIYAYQGAQIINRSGAIFDIQTSADIFWTSTQGAQSLFENAGTLIKSAGGSDRSYIAAKLNNTGIIDVQAFTLDLSGTGASSGLIMTSAGATLQVSDPYTLSASSLLNSNGILHLSGGTFNVVTGSPIVLNHLSLAGGTLGGSDDVIVNGNATWNSGTVSGSGKLRTNGVTTLETSVTRILSTRLWENAGTVIWSAGVMTFNSGASFSNLAGATLELRSNNTPLGFTGTRPTLANAGVIVKSAGTGTTTLNHLLVNSGVVRADVGTLSFEGGGEGAGSFLAQPGAKLDFNGQTFNLLSGSALRGETMRFNAGTVNIEGTYEVTGTTDIAGATVNMSNATDLQAFGNTLTLSSGTLNLNSGQMITLAMLSISGGTLNGSDDVIVNGSASWGSGTVSGSGKLRTNGTTTLSTSVVRTLNGRLWENAGAILWNAGTMTFNSGASLSNLSGGVLDLRVDNQMLNVGSGQPVPTLNNAGTIVKSAGTGTSTINHRVVNSGIVRAATGILSLSGGGEGSGSFLALPGAKITFASAFNLVQGSLVQGETMRFTSGTVNIEGTYEVTGTTEVAGATVNISNLTNLVNLGSGLDLSSGTLNLNSGQMITLATFSISGGTLNGSDDVIVNGNASWGSGTVSGSGKLRTNGATTLSSSVTRTINGRLWENAGTVLWNAGSMTFNSGASLSNLSGGVLDLRVDNQMLNVGSGQPVPTLANAGTMVKSAGTGTSTIVHRVENSGIVRAATGILSLNGSGEGNGSFLALPGAKISLGGSFNLAQGSVVQGETMRFTSGTVNIEGTYEVTGTTEVAGATVNISNLTNLVNLGSGLDLSSGTFNLNNGNATTLATLSISGGTLNGSDDVIINGNASWGSGTVSGSGKLRTNGTTTLSSSVTRVINGRLWENAGTILWNAGSMTFNSGASLSNLSSGVLDLRVDGGLLNVGSGQPVPTLNNAGTMVKSAGTGTTTINHRVENSGTLKVMTGIVAIGNSYTQMVSGRLFLDIIGATAGSQLRQLNVSGVATLGGALEISRSNGYTPNLGVSLAILSFNTRSGQFAVTDGMEIDGSRQFQVRYDDGGKKVFLDVVAASGLNTTGVESAAPAAEENPGVQPVEEITGPATSHTLYLPMITQNAPVEAAQPVTDPSMEEAPVEEHPVEEVPAPEAIPQPESEVVVPERFVGEGETVSENNSFSPIYLPLIAR
jgi:hypothetical protein